MTRPRRGRGEGSIEQLPSGKFRAVLSNGFDVATGERRKMTYTAGTKKEALAWLRDRLQEQGRGTLADAGKLTVVGWLNQWLEMKKPKVEPRSWEPHEAHVRLHLTPHLGSLPLVDLRPMHVERMYSGMTADGTSAPMQRKVGTTFRMALKDAVRLNLISVNPALAVEQPKATKPEIAIWTAAEARQFLAAANGERLECLYVVALDSGMRMGELFGLHWPQVDFDGGAVMVTQALEMKDGQFRLKPPKTKAGRRRLALTSATMTALHEHRKRMLAEGRDVKRGPVFVGATGNFLRGRDLHSNSFERIKEAAGVPPITFHALRHTSATLLLLNGINVKAVSVRLGHASVQITLDTYGHFLPEMDVQTVGVLEKMLFRGDCPTVVPPEAGTAKGGLP